MRLSVTKEINRPSEGCYISAPQPLTRGIVKIKVLIIRCTVDLAHPTVSPVTGGGQSKASAEASFSSIQRWMTIMLYRTITVNEARLDRNLPHFVRLLRKSPLGTFD